MRVCEWWGQSSDFKLQSARAFQIVSKLNRAWGMESEHQSLENSPALTTGHVPTDPHPQKSRPWTQG